MTVVAFLLGLFIGIGFWLGWQAWIYRQLKLLLRSLQVPGTDSALPPLSRLRSGIALVNEHRQHLEFQMQTWEQILQIAPCGFIMVDEENQLLWCNEEARQLLNIDRWEPGQVRLLLELVRSYELDELIDQTRDRQQTIQQEWLFHSTYSHPEAINGGRSEYCDRLNPKSLTLRATSWPLADGQVGVFLENRQALVELAQTKERWVSDLAHELRTPLTSIRLVAEALQNRLEPPMSRWVERLLPEINRLINLVQDWLELSQLEADAQNKLHRKPLELHSLIFSVWHSLEPLSAAKQIDLIYSGPDPLWLDADESRLYRVFLNILDNSIKYSPCPGVITVEVNLLPETDSPKLVEIDVIDRGPGFPDSDLPYVFERLYRGDPSRKREAAATDREGKPTLSTNGSGLGLAIVRQIILAHGGSVTAKNHPETGGAWLKIELPYAQAIASPGRS